MQTDLRGILITPRRTEDTNVYSYSILWHLAEQTDRIENGLKDCYNLRG